VGDAVLNLGLSPNLGSLITSFSENISSTIPIRITVYWEDLGENSLGGAGPSEYVKDFPNGPKSIAFPIALAEKIAQQPINSDRDADIFVDLNRNVDWFYDFDNPTSISATQFDFVSVALHELLHGIGFLGFAKVEARRGSLKSVLLYPDCTGNACHGPSIYDVYLTHLSESNLCEHFSDPSRALENALTDDNLFLLTSSFEEEVNLPKVYAPASFNLGASIYHLDQTTYEATPNSLMTPFIGTGEMEHDLGISLNVLYDLGWGSEMPTFTDILSPSIEHIPIRSIDDKTVGVPIEVIVEDLFSNVESVSIELVLNGVQQPTITSTRVFGDPFRSNVYTANIELPTPISPTDKLEYRIVAVDDSEQANKRTHPVEGFHTIVIEKTQAATITYLNDFNVVSNDFSGDGFSITPIPMQRKEVFPTSSIS